MSAEETAVRGWLAEKGLEELTSAFVSKEDCDVELMQKIGLDDDDLDFLEITDATQRAILQGKQAAASMKPAAAKAEPKAAAKAVSAEETAVRGWLAEKGLEEL